MARQQARRHHRERVAGALVVCLGIAVLVIAVIALREPNGHVVAAQSQQSTSNAAQNSSHSSSAHPNRSASHSSAPPTSDSQTSHTVKDIPLVILNNTTVPHLAAQAERVFEAGGWTVTRVDNYQNDIVSTCAYYDPSVPGARTAAMALQQQYSTIKRVKPRFSELPAGPIVVVLTPDYSAAG